MVGRIRCLIVCLVALIILSGCSAFRIYETAQTTPPGRFALSGTFTPISISSSIFKYKYNEVLVLPIPALSLRMGITDNFDLGLNFDGPSIGGTVTGKCRLLRGPLDGALAAYGSAYIIPVLRYAFSLYRLESRFIISRETPGVFLFSASARLKCMGALGSFESLSGMLGFGLPFRLGKQRSFRIMPGLSIDIPIYPGINTGNDLHMDIGVGFGYAPQSKK
ncbi:hypothetical protein HPY86_01810 [candidate division WOR-3 bacterium]|jgi:hypothetical protein|nr:hypothetical protein [candidate division WOR-3 bacterium]